MVPAGRREARRRSPATPERADRHLHLTLSGEFAAAITPVAAAEPTVTFLLKVLGSIANFIVIEWSRREDFCFLK